MFWLWSRKKSCCFSLLTTHRQVPTSGPPFSQEPGLRVLEAALLYTEHKRGFHGNISEGGREASGGFVALDK